MDHKASANGAQQNVTRMNPPYEHPRNESASFLHPSSRGRLGRRTFLRGAGTLLALGTFISTLTKNQIIAGAATFGVCLLLWVLEWTSGYETSTWARVLAYFSIITHFESFAKGVIEAKDVIFYLSGIFLGLFFTARSMESMRWRS